MAMFDDEERRPRPRTHVVGEDLAKLSIAELEERVGALTAEIDRIHIAIRGKQASHDAAQSFFKS